MLLEREEGRERKKKNIDVSEKHQSIGCFLLQVMTRDQTHNLVMCPDCKSNLQPFSQWDGVPTTWATLARALYTSFLSRITFHDSGPAEISSLYHMPHPEAAGLTEQWDGLPKPQLQCKQEENILWENNIPIGWDACLKPAANDNLGSIGGTYKFEIQDIEVEVATFAMTVNYTLE